MLIEHEFQALLLAAGVCRLDLRLELPRLLGELGGFLLEFRLELCFFAACKFPLALQFLESHAGLRDFHFRFLEFPGDAVALGCAPVHAGFQAADLVAHLLEFTLLDLRQVCILRERSRQRGEYTGHANAAKGARASHGA